MSQYNIQPDPQLPSDEEIRAQMNFNEVYSRYTATNAHQRHWWQRLRLTPRLFGGMALVLAIGLLVYEAIEEEEQAEKVARRAETLLNAAHGPVAPQGGVQWITSNDTHFIRISPDKRYGQQPPNVTLTLPDSQRFAVACYNPKRSIWEALPSIRPQTRVNKTFRLDLLLAEFPELAAIKDLHWQHLGGPDIDSLGKTMWESIRAERRQEGTFALWFTKGKDTEIILARPISGSLANAPSQYQYTLPATQAGLYQLVRAR